MTHSRVNSKDSSIMGIGKGEEVGGKKKKE
jgi:hypothetical protein